MKIDITIYTVQTTIWHVSNNHTTVLPPYSYASREEATEAIYNDGTSGERVEFHWDHESEDGMLKTAKCYEGWDGCNYEKVIEFQMWEQTL